MSRNIPGASPAKGIALVRATARIGVSNGRERIFPAWLKYLTHSCPLCRLDDSMPRGKDLIPEISRTSCFLMGASLTVCLLTKLLPLHHASRPSRLVGLQQERTRLETFRCLMQFRAGSGRIGA